MKPHAPFDHDDDIAWQAQERARLAASRGATARGDADLLVARALHSAPMPALPADFAASVAQRVQASVASPRAAQASDRVGVEAVLTVVLGVCLGIAGLVFAWLYSAAWSSGFAPLADAVPDAMLQWIGLGLLCVVTTAVFARLTPTRPMQHA